MLIQNRAIPQWTLTSNLQARDLLAVRELEAETLGVVAQLLNSCQLQVNPSLVTADENTLALLGGLSGRDAGVVAVQTDTGASEDNSGVEGGERAALGGFRGVLAEALQRLSWAR